MGNVTYPTSGSSPSRVSVWRRWLSRVGLALALAAGLAYLPYQLLDGRGLRVIPKLEEDLAHTREKIGELRVENKQYRRETEALKTDPHAIEDIARDEVGMVRPGELVIRVELELGPTDSGTRAGATAPELELGLNRGKR